MFKLNEQSINRRLTFLLVFAAGFTFLASFISFVTYERGQVRRNMVRNLKTQALVLSQAVAADLDFGGLLNNIKSMQFLSTNKHILAARIFDDRGQVFSTMATPKNSTSLPAAAPAQEAAHFRPGELDVFVKIFQDDIYKGTLFLRSDTDELDAQYFQALTILAASIPGLLLLILLVSTLLKRQVSTPILKLAETAEQISRARTFAIRLQRTQGGEIGALTEAFNDMLSQLQQRDAQLLDHQEHLEEQVAQRSEQLLQTKQLLSATLDALPVYIAILDNAGTILSTNRKWTQFEDPNNRFIYGARVGDTYRVIRELLPPDQASTRQEYDFASTGGHRWFTVQAARFVTGDTHHTVLMHLEITEQRLMESQLRQAQKLESIGQLAAGIAHEINTPTQYIGDNTTFLGTAFQELGLLLATLQEILADPAQGGGAPELLAAAEQARQDADLGFLQEEIPKAILQCLEGVSRVSRIVSAMKDFSHPGTSDKVLTDLNRAIESTTLVCRSEWKYVATLELDLDPKLPFVPVLPDEFNQVILNLIINAAHAIGDALALSKAGLGTLKVTTRSEGPWVEIRIQDSGAGIPEAIRSRIFDPFFTTKPVGKGTGQGLAIAFATIVGKHGGTIAVSSEVGVGSTFTLRLPLQATEPAEAAAP